MDKNLGSWRDIEITGRFGLHKKSLFYCFTVASTNLPIYLHINDINVVRCCCCSYVANVVELTQLMLMMLLAHYLAEV